MIGGATSVITERMKLRVVLALVLGLAACGGKKSSSSTTPNPSPDMGGATYGGATYGGNTYGGATYGGAR